MAGSHICKALIITCMDFRIQKAVAAFAEAEGLTGKYDLVALAGAQRALLQPETETEVMMQVDLSKRLHGIEEVIFVSHDDCGAYGGSGAFDSLEGERAKYQQDMRQAVQVVEAAQEGLKARGVILQMDPDGNFTGDVVT